MTYQQPNKPIAYLKNFTLPELELNRSWVYDNEPNEDPIGERNFVITQKYFFSIFEKLFPLERDIHHFLEVYEPETDGEKIYQQAVKDGQLIDEFDSVNVNNEHVFHNNNKKPDMVLSKRRNLYNELSKGRIEKESFH